MDLGIAGRVALVCAASKGLGKASALALAREGVKVTILARGVEALEATAAEIRAATGAEVTTVAADVTTEAGRERIFVACPPPDILVNNAAGPPPGDWRDWRREDWIAALDANMLTAIEMMKRTVPAMVERGFGRVVNITSSAVKDPIAVLGLSNGARAGLTGFVAGLSRDLAPTGVTINNLLPGPSTPTASAMSWSRARRSPAGPSRRSGSSACRRRRCDGSARWRSSARPAPSSAACMPAT